MENVQAEKLPTDENELAICNAVQKLLHHNGINSFEPEVTSHLVEYIDAYLLEVLGNAKLFMKHAGRTDLCASDVELAIKNYTDKIKNTGLRHKDLLEKARELNKKKLPEITEHYGLRLPSADAMTKCNYKLKELNTHVNYIDYTVTDSSVGNALTSNAVKNTFGISTIIRTPKKSAFINNTVNLNPQRIAFKPKINIGNYNINPIPESAKKCKYN